MTDRPAGFDQAVEAMAQRLFAFGGTYKAWASFDRDVREGYIALATAALTALLAERVETPCPDCGGSGITKCVPDCDGLVSSHSRCPACHGSGKVASDVPLIVMGSGLERIGWRSDAADAGPRWTIDPALAALDGNRGWYPVYRVRARIEGEPRG